MPALLNFVSSIVAYYSDHKERILKSAKEWVMTIVVIVCINFVAFQPFKIPSESMVPTFLIGDFLIVNKFCYGYSNDSFRIGNFTFPLPKITGRLFARSLPKYGDVVVFRNPNDRDVNYVKRVIGLPGDTVQVKNGIVYVNDQPLQVIDDGEYVISDNGRYVVYRKYQEVLPNGYKHVILKFFQFGQAHLDNVGPFVVPSGHYFCMGDNRDNSQDSRVMEKVGFVPLERIMGRAECLFFSLSCKIYEIFKIPFSIRFERIFTAIR